LNEQGGAPLPHPDNNQVGVNNQLLATVAGLKEVVGE
jgi:hypothetical protein